MAGWALGLMVFYLALAFGVRVAIQIRRTGSSGIASTASAPPAELVGGGMFLCGVALGSINPLLAVLDVIQPIEGLDATASHAGGFALVALGIAGTFAAQMAMGAAWRIGVDPAERTELVTSGLFAHVRNPIYTAMMVAWLGFALLVPTWLMLASGGLLVGGIEIQVRAVEEPHLLRSHGAPYRAYAVHVGRFLPGIGRIREARRA